MARTDDKESSDVLAKMTLAEIMRDIWREVEEPRHIFRTFGSSRNCNNCYFRNFYKIHNICRRHLVRLPEPVIQFKCGKWEKK